jgi:hypothetical protein
MPVTRGIALIRVVLKRAVTNSPLTRTRPRRRIQASTIVSLIRRKPSDGPLIPEPNSLQSRTIFLVYGAASRRGRLDKVPDLA